MPLIKPKNYSAASCLLFLSACATQSAWVPVEDKTSYQVIKNKSDIETATDETTNRTSSPKIEQNVLQNNPVQDRPEPVILAFLQQAEQEVSQGNTRQAIATLERGIRLQPKDPWLWHQLAVLRLQQSEWHKSIVMAEKSISLAQGNQGLISANWQIIAQAKRLMGDESGAREAEKKLGILSG